MEYYNVNTLFNNIIIMTKKIKNCLESFIENMSDKDKLLENNYLKKITNFIKEKWKKYLSRILIFWIIFWICGAFLAFSQTGQNLKFEIEKKWQKIEKSLETKFDKYDINYELSYLNDWKTYLIIEDDNCKNQDHSNDNRENKDDKDGEYDDRKNQDRKHKRHKSDRKENIKIELNQTQINKFKNMTLQEKKDFANSFLTN